MVRVLKTPFLTQGPEIRRFEEEFAQFCGAKYAVACSSATAGLHLSAMVLGMGPRDVWWTSPNTFCATADAALRCGAGVDFIDIEWGTYNMDLGLLEDRLKKAARKNRLPKVVAPVHFGGNPVDMEFLDKLRRSYGFNVVEDAAHATGAELRGERVGSCRWSDLCVFSFHAVKIITTGEGGMVTTNSARLYEKLLRLRTHGISRDRHLLLPARRRPWFYEKLELGNHYRMTDFQAALGLSQLRKINDFRQKRQKLAERYDRTLADTELNLPELTSGAVSSWHLYVVTVPGHDGSGRRDRLLGKLRDSAIQANLHYVPVTSLAFYRARSDPLRAKGRLMACPVASRYADCALSLPIFPGLKPTDQDKVNRELRGSL